MGVNSLPKTVTRQRRVCDFNSGPSAPESSTLTTRLPSHPVFDCLVATARRVLATLNARNTHNAVPVFDMISRRKKTPKTIKWNSVIIVSDDERLQTATCVSNHGSQITTISVIDDTPLYQRTSNKAICKYCALTVVITRPHRNLQHKLWPAVTYHCST